jgi:hypothetical protein
MAPSSAWTSRSAIPSGLSRLFAYGGTDTAAGFKASAADTPTFKAGLAHCAADYARMSPTPVAKKFLYGNLDLPISPLGIPIFCEARLKAGTTD